MNLAVRKRPSLSMLTVAEVNATVDFYERVLGMTPLSPRQQPGRRGAGC